MSWSITATGHDAEETMNTFTEALHKDQHCPPHIADAVIKAAVHLAEPLPKLVCQISSSGHMDADGKGYASVSVLLK